MLLQQLPGLRAAFANRPLVQAVRLGYFVHLRGDLVDYQQPCNFAHGVAALGGQSQVVVEAFVDFVPVREQVVDQLAQPSLFARPLLDCGEGLRWTNCEGRLLAVLELSVAIDLVYEFRVDLFFSPAGAKAAVL